MPAGGAESITVDDENTLESLASHAVSSSEKPGDVEAHIWRNPLLSCKKIEKRKKTKQSARFCFVHPFSFCFFIICT